MIDSEAIKTEITFFDQPEIVPSSYTTVHTIDSEGNMGNLSKTMLIDISVKTGIVENIHIGEACNPEEIARFTSIFKEFRDVFAWSHNKTPDIDPPIDEKEIKKFQAFFLWYFSHSLIRKTSSSLLQAR